MFAQRGAPQIFGAGRRFLRTLIFNLPSALIAFVLCFACSQSFSQATAPNDEQAYREAIAAAGPSGNILKLERFASTTTGPYKKDALQWLVWSYRQMGDSSMATKWAYVLQGLDPNNALALALLANDDQQITHTAPGDSGADQALSLAKQALRELDRLAKPYGMTEPSFAALKTELARNLNGAIGYAYFQRHDYVTSRGYLRKAVASAPDNAQYTYALALADFEGDADTSEGFRMLARSVNLTLGTPAGRELATFARTKYRSIGGNDAGWDGFLAATRVVAPTQPMTVHAAVEPSMMPTTPASAATTTVAANRAPATTPPPVSATPPPTTTPTPSATTAATPPQTTLPTTGGAASQPTQAASASQPATSYPAQIGSASPIASATRSANSSQSSGLPARIPPPPAQTSSASAISTAQSSPAPTTSATPAPATPPSSAPTQAAPAQNTSAQSTEVASASPAPTRTGSREARREVPPLPPMANTGPPIIRPKPPMRVFSSDAPISMGILIETATTSSEARANVINALTDMVRRLRPKDEAFLVSFSNEVVFEQDLTNSSKSLEEAMDRIKPMPGTALFDAVAFASGHLKRIAANQNRVLLVISDGSNNTNTISPLELSGEITVSGVKIFCIGMQASTAENQQRLRALANATGGQAVFLGGANEFRGAAREVAAQLGIPF